MHTKHKSTNSFSDRTHAGLFDIDSTHTHTDTTHTAAAAAYLGIYSALTRTIGVDCTVMRPIRAFAFEYLLSLINRAGFAASV